MLLFIGTQANAAGQGIVAARLDEETGALAALPAATTVERPTWLLADPDAPLLYAVSEVGDAAERQGEVLSFAVEGDAGTLRLLSRVPAGGGGPTHLALDADGGTLFVANFTGGQVASIPVATDGVLVPPRSVERHAGSGPHRRQVSPHPHGVTLDPTRRYLLAPDMGSDRVYVYAYDAADHALAPATPAHAALPAGSGPRLLLFGASGRIAYLLSELTAEIFVFMWDAGRGRLQPLDHVALDEPGVEDGRSAAGLAITADGRTLYASNRRTHAIHAYAIDERNGRLSLRQAIPAGGTKPWSLTIAPGGGWLVVTNQGSDDVRAFAIDPTDGTLSPGAGALAVPVPTSVAFPAGTRLA